MSKVEDYVKNELALREGKKAVIVSGVPPEKPKETLLYKIIKWLTALSPVYIPFTLCMIFSRDILLSVLITLTIDLIIIIGLVAYVLKQSNVVVK